jgi:hypothetical protein
MRLRMRILAMTNLVCSLLVGCVADGGTGVPPTSPISRLDQTGGCGDIRLDAWSTSRSASFRAVLPKMIDVVEPQATATLHVGDAGVTISLDLGQQLQSEACPDYGEPDTVIDQRFTAVSGTVEVELRPSSGEYPTASAVFQDLVLRDEQGAELEIEHFEILDAMVGWLAG